MDCSPPGSSVRGIIQARMLEWVAISYSMGNAEIKPPSSVSPALGGGLFRNESPEKSFSSVQLVSRVDSLQPQEL